MSYNTTDEKLAEQGWCSGQSTRLPPIRRGFYFLTRRRLCIEFVGSLLCSPARGFLPGTLVFPSHQKQAFDSICCGSVWFIFSSICKDILIKSPRKANEIDAISIKVIFLDWKRSSGWLESWEGLLLVTDVSITCAEAIFRVKATYSETLPLWLRYVDDTITAVHEISRAGLVQWQSTRLPPIRRGFYFLTRRRLCIEFEIQLFRCHTILCYALCYVILC